MKRIVIFMMFLAGFSQISASGFDTAVANLQLQNYNDMRNICLNSMGTIVPVAAASLMNIYLNDYRTSHERMVDAACAMTAQLLTAMPLLLSNSTSTDLTKQPLSKKWTALFHGSALGLSYGTLWYRYYNKPARKKKRIELAAQKAKEKAKEKALELERERFAQELSAAGALVWEGRPNTGIMTTMYRLLG